MPSNRSSAGKALTPREVTVNLSPEVSKPAQASPREVSINLSPNVARKAKAVKKKVPFSFV